MPVLAIWTPPGCRRVRGVAGEWASLTGTATVAGGAAAAIPGGRHGSELVVDAHDRLQVALEGGVLLAAGAGQEALVLHVPPPQAQPVHERDVVRHPLVGPVGLHVPFAGEAAETERFAQAAGGHAPAGLLLGHTVCDPVGLLWGGQFGQQPVVFPRESRSRKTEPVS